MDPSWLSIGLGFAGFIGNVIVLVIAGTWALSRMELRLTADRNKDRFEVSEELTQVRREFGETIVGFRTKINDVELYIRDHYLSKETFNLVIANFGAELKGLGDRLEVRMLRMENKIDRVSDKQ